MKAFDTDVLTEILSGNPAYADRIAQVPAEKQFAPIVAVEELLRGRLNAIRQAEAGKSRVTIERAYELLDETLSALRVVETLPFSEQVEQLWKEWRRQRLRGSTHDLRIAASCVVTSTTLVTRNRRDFEGLPGLMVEVWD